jgi:hypothetical protein
MAKTQLMMTNRLLGALIRTIVFTGLFIGPTAWVQVLCAIIAGLNALYALYLVPGDITREPIEENKA